MYGREVVMADLWKTIERLQGQTVLTVRSKAFDVLAVTPEAVVIRVESTNNVRPIPMGNFERAAPLKRPGKPLRPIDVRAAGASEVNPAYVAAILNKLLP